MIIPFKQKLINHDLQQYANGKRTELVSDERSGLYIEVRPSGNGVGTYYLRYKNKDGKSCHERIGRTNVISLADARQKVALLKAEIEKGNSIDNQKAAKKGDMLLNDFWVEYIAFAKSTKRSWKRDEQLFRLRIQPRFGHLKLSEINVRQIQKLMMDIRTEGLSGATADHHGQLMRRMSLLAVKWGCLDVNFARGIELYHEFNQVDNVPSDVQMQRLMDILKTDKNRSICLIVQFLLSTGCRLNEALSAEWKNISIEKKLLSIPMEHSKSKRIRHIPLNESALNVLQQINRKENHNIYVFTNAKTNTRYVNIFKPWARIRTAAGLPNLTLHTLRHAYANYCIEAGCTLFEVQNLLGHQDSRVTQRYTKISTDTLLTAANSVSKKLSGFTQPQLEVVKSGKAA